LLHYMIMQAEEWHKEGSKKSLKLMFTTRTFRPNWSKRDRVTACWTICKAAGMWLCVDVQVVPDISKDRSAFSSAGTTCQTAKCHLAECLNLQQHSFVARSCIRVCSSCDALTRNWTRAPRVATLGQRVNRRAAPSSAGHGLPSDAWMCDSCSCLLSQKSWPN